MADIDSVEPIFALSEEALKNMTLAQAKVEFNRTTFISDKVRAECLFELEQAKKNGYKIYKHPKT